MWSLLVIALNLILIFYAQSNEKVPYKSGTICNIEAYFNAKGVLAVNRFFCVSDSLCRKGIHRFPFMDYDGCNSVMSSPESSSERLVCCHQREILEDLSTHYQVEFTYLTGLKSFIMCKEYSHAICGPQGSYCEADATEAQKFQGLPTAISKYPHTALIGYYNSTNNFWIWFCQGSIVSKIYILTVWSCVTYDHQNATNVKIGESRLCHLDYCPDNEEEQNLKIISMIRQDTRQGPHDLVLLEVTDIMFNKKVRPACLFYQSYTRQSQGWFARYSKPNRTLFKTFPGGRPVFMNPEDVTAFKLRTAGEARIMLSRTGLPYRKEFHYEIILGAINNTESLITRSDGPNFSRSPTPVNVTTNILSSSQFRGFWIHFQPHKVTVGKEDSVIPFLVYDDQLTDLYLGAMGISTPNSYGEWTFNDYKAFTSLHDFEAEVTYTDECKEALGEPPRPEDEHINDTSMFCVRGLRNKTLGIQYGPCNKDWGGAIQMQDERTFCMWQIFGVFLRESPRNCSMVEKPSLFKSLNRPGVLDWLETMLFPNFSIWNVTLERPVCVGPFLRKRPT